MKPLQKLPYAVVAMAVVLFIACAVDPLENLVPDTETEEIENPDYEIIRSLGFSTENIIEYEDRYVVEGDIAIDRDSIEFYLPKTRQAYHSLITGGREDGIRVKVTSESVQNAG